MRKNNIFQKFKALWVILGVLVAYKVWSTFKSAGLTAGAIAGNLNNSVTTAVINQAANNGNIPPMRSNELIAIVERIYAAFYKYWGGMAEDEEAAATAFNECRNFNEAIFVATIYKQSFKKSLYADIDKYTKMPHGQHAASWFKFNSAYLNSIKNI